MKRMAFVLFFILLLPVSTMATGPSNIFSIIQPVSVNSDGVILCKTKFQQNHLGAHRVMPVNYGWDLEFPDGEIKEYSFHYVDTDSYEDEAVIFKHYEYLESLFTKSIDWDKAPVSLLPLIEEYGFNSNNADMFIVDKEMNLETFLTTYNLGMED